MAAETRELLRDGLYALAHVDSFETTRLMAQIVHVVDQIGFRPEGIVHLIQLYEHITTLISEIQDYGVPGPRSVRARVAVVDMFYAVSEEPERAGLLPLVWSSEFVNSTHLLNESLEPCAMWLLVASALLASHTRIYSGSADGRKVWPWLQAMVVQNKTFARFAGQTSNEEILAIPTFEGKFARLLQIALELGPSMYVGPLAWILDQMNKGNLGQA